MKLVLKLLTLLGLAIAFWWSLWWFSLSNSRPQAQSSSQKNVATENIVADRAIKNDDRSNAVVTFTAFDTPAEASQWRTVNDNVMGGISQSTFSVTPDGTGLFSGTISLENNGGFSSVRRNVGEFDFSGMDAITLRIKGDGRRYQLRFRTDSAGNAISYRAEFDTRQDEWINIRLPLESFEPVFRGRVLNDAPPLVASEIQQIGFLLADKQDGEFRLETDWIRVE